MPLTPSLLTQRRVRWLGAPLNLLLLLLLAALLAHWTWRFAAPLPPLPAAAAPAEVPLALHLASLRAARLFGGGKGGAAASTEQATTLNIKLRGVFAALGSVPAMAIVGVDGQDQTVSIGQEIVPGVVLDAVEPGHVSLLNRGVRERLELDAVGRPLTLADGDIPLQRQEINQALANPQSLGAQAQVQAGSGTQPGLVFTSVDASGLAARLGLQSGDILRRVNDRPVTSMEDFARLISDASGGQRITVLGERQGAPLMLAFRLE